MEYKFKDPDAIININGQRIHSGNLTKENYEYLINFNKSYEDLFVVAAQSENPPKVKLKSNGQAKEESTGN